MENLLLQIPLYGKKTHVHLHNSSKLFDISWT
jgi:hypothetical protein